MLILVIQVIFSQVWFTPFFEFSECFNMEIKDSQTFIQLFKSHYEKIHSFFNKEDVLRDLERKVCLFLCSDCKNRDFTLDECLKVCPKYDREKREKIREKTKETFYDPVYSPDWRGASFYYAKFVRSKKDLSSLELMKEVIQNGKKWD